VYGGGGSPLNPHGGAGWLDDGMPDAASHAYKRYHVRSSVLATSTTYGPTLTFAVGSDPSLLDSLRVGERVNVTYTQRGNGTLVARGVG
jgi:hypothetical protein